LSDIRTLGISSIPWNRYDINAGDARCSYKGFMEMIKYAIDWSRYEEK